MSLVVRLRKRQANMIEKKCTKSVPLFSDGVKMMNGSPLVFIVLPPKYFNYSAHGAISAITSAIVCNHLSPSYNKCKIATYHQLINNWTGSRVNQFLNCLHTLIAISLDRLSLAAKSLPLIEKCQDQLQQEILQLGEDHSDIAVIGGWMCWRSDHKCTEQSSNHVNQYLSECLYNCLVE